MSEHDRLYLRFYDRLQHWCNRLCESSTLRGDLLQECALSVMGKDIDYLNDVAQHDSKINSFCYSVVYNQWRSKTSPFYYKYRKHTHHNLRHDMRDTKTEQPLYYTDLILLNKSNALESLNEVDSQVLPFIVDYGSVRQLAMAAGIPYSSLWSRVNRIRKTISEDIKRSNND